jgi:hypothetical protein
MKYGTNKWPPFFRICTCGASEFCSPSPIANSSPQHHSTSSASQSYVVNEVSTMSKVPHEPDGCEPLPLKLSCMILLFCRLLLNRSFMRVWGGPFNSWTTAPIWQPEAHQSDATLRIGLFLLLGLHVVVPISNLSSLISQLDQWKGMAHLSCHIICSSNTRPYVHFA